MIYVLGRARTGVREMTYYDILLWMLMVTIVLVFMVWLGLELHYASLAPVSYSHRLRRRALTNDDIGRRLFFSKNSSWSSGAVGTALLASPTRYF